MRSAHGFAASIVLGFVIACTPPVEVTDDVAVYEGPEVVVNAPACAASPTWVTNPAPPDDVTANGPNCEFHQFAWQWFLSLTSPVAPDSAERNFEDSTRHPILGVDPCPGSEPSEVLLASDSLGLGIRTSKPRDSGPFPFFLPKDITQAGSNEPLVDQAGNVVYYNIRYTPNECDVNPNSLDASFPNTPPNTVTELKTAWRQIDTAEASRFFTAEGTIVDSKGNSQTLLLGLVGFHLVKNSPNHPEFIWATFEHKDNAPVCNPPVPAPLAPAAGWSFASQTCADCLETPYSGTCPQTLQDCKFNIYPGDLKPTEVCRASENGGGNLNNQTNITSLNEQLTGPSGILTGLPSDDPMAVFKNYMHVGTLWLRNPTSNLAPWIQDGSVDLASTVMETYDQPPLPSGGAPQTLGKNCFTCHTFNGSENTATLSHILPIQGAQILIE
ncbi:MAG: hypothetical protein AAGC60_26425 [Acidobacteriota bacterium]